MSDVVLCDHACAINYFVLLGDGELLEAVWRSYLGLVFHCRLAPPCVLYKDALHRCFKFNPIPAVFLSLCSGAARMILVRHFCY